MLWTFLLAFFLNEAHAKNAAPPMKPVIWYDGYSNNLMPDYPPSQYEYADAPAQERALREEGYLQPEERDALFRKIGIETKVASLDQMDKDILLLTARSYTARELQKQYPMLSPQDCLRLKREAEKIR